MRISVQNARVTDRLGIDEGFKLLHDTGFQGTDFGLTAWLRGKDIIENLPAVKDQPLEKLYEILRPYKEAADKHGIFVSQTHASFPTWCAGKGDEVNDRVLEALKKDIAMTAYMGSPYVIIHPFFNMVNRERPTAEEEWELNRDRYSALIPTLKEYNVVCCLENMFVGGPEGMRYAAVCSDFREAAEWIDKLNDIAGEERFGFCMDTGHCHLTGQNMRRALNFIGHRLKTLHIHDNDGHTDWHMGAFMGTTDWELFIEGLRDINYEGDLSFETFKVLDNFPPEMMEICLRMIAESGKYFKQRLGK